MVRIAVIGAGSSGITAVKTCLEYDYDVVCYEKTHDLGGLWRYKPHECKDEASVMKSTVINTSKEMGAFSDFPPPPEFANFMHNRQMLTYFRMYAEKFNVLPYIKYGMEVQSVERAGDYERNGQWVVSVKDLGTGHIKTDIFDGALLCTGHHVRPYEPEFVGLKDGTFKGRILHSHSYKDASGFVDKNVLVVGIGNSGVDVAVELSRNAKQVYMVTRRGSWILPRMFDNGDPIDMHMHSHFTDHMIKIAPRLMQAMSEKKLLQKFDLERFGLMPSHHLYQQHPTMSDELPGRILNGTITIKTNIDRFVGDHKCVFDDGTAVDEIDAVILCTGYAFGFPYLESGIIPIHNNHVELYKYMYAPNLERPETLAVIGLFQPLGAIFPICEMQTRVFCEYIRRRPNRLLPDRSEMLEDIAKKLSFTKSVFVESHRHTIEVQPVPFMQDLARMIDAEPLPPLMYLLKGDPKLAWALAVGPCLAYEFRLRGPNPWIGARDAIVSVWDRVEAATKTRKAPAHICGAGRKHGMNCFLHEKMFVLVAFAVISIAVLLGMMYV